MKLLKTVVRTGLHRAGGLALVRRLQPGLRILMYHRFHREHMEALEQQCRHMRRYYKPVSMTEVAESIKSGRPLPSNSVAITVDDGYRDFLECAAPVFNAHDIPATVYLVSGFLDGRLWLWWDRIHFALRSTLRREVHVDGQTLPLGTSEQQTSSWDRITLYAKELPNRQRVQFIQDLVQQLEVTLPETPPPDCAPLSWEEVRQLRGHGIEFGSHSVTHPILSRLEDPAELEHEVRFSQLRIAQELEEPVQHFCYPNGQQQDWNEEVVDVVSRAGFATAVTTIGGLNRRIESPFRLLRLPTDPDLPVHYFAEVLAGMH